MPVALDFYRAELYSCRAFRNGARQPRAAPVSGFNSAGEFRWRNHGAVQRVYAILCIL